MRRLRSTGARCFAPAPGRRRFSSSRLRPPRRRQASRRPGVLVFNNLSCYWLYGDWRRGRGAGEHKREVRLGDRHDPVDLARSRHRERGRSVSRRRCTRTHFRQPGMGGGGRRRTVTNAGGTWIRYMFTWTGSLTPNFSTAILEASVPFTERSPEPARDQSLDHHRYGGWGGARDRRRHERDIHRAASAVIRCGGVPSASSRTRTVD